MFTSLGNTMDIEIYNNNVYCLRAYYKNYKLLNYYKNEKNTLLKFIENSWESPIREINF